MRYTRNIVQSRIDTVKAQAEELGMTYIDHLQRFPYANISIYSGNETHALHVMAEQDSGVMELGTARGWREIARYLEGMSQVLYSMKLAKAGN